MSNNKLKPTFHFRTNVELKSILGKELINNDNIAVLELIKNSLDAGSPKVDVYFENIKSNDGTNLQKPSKIIIQDYGSGMDESDIVNKWLNIAYSEKKKVTDKILAGAKGIGRLSCDRLGEYLDIYSKRENKEIIHLRIDWKSFEFEGIDIETKDIEIQDIGVEVENLSDEEFEETGHSLFQKGTLVEISNLRTDWNEDKLKKLRHYLERLLNPNQSLGNKTFAIYIHASEFDKSISGEIKNQIFEKLDFTTTVIESFISKDGNEITTSLRDRGKDVFTIIEKNSNALLKDIKIVIYYLNTYSKIYFAKQTGIRAVNYGSIFLFKNGFRISPYGDEGNDWLRLEIRKGQGRARYFGTRDLVGRIEINDFVGDFKEVSSREGLVENELFHELTDKKDGFFFETLKRLERFVIDGLDWDKVPEDILKKALTKDFQSSLSEEKEEYLLTPDDRNKSILDSLYSIIRANSKTIIDIDIDTELIASLIKEEQEKADKVINEFEKYGESKLNSKTFKVLLDVKQKVLKREKTEAERKAKHAEEAKKKAEEYAQKSEEARQQEKEKRKKAEDSLEKKTEQLRIVTAISSQDIDNVTNLHHQVIVISDTIKTLISTFSRRINKDTTVSVTDVKDFLNKLSYENTKVESISRFGTRAIFEDFTSLLENNIVEFIQKYIEKVSIYFLTSTLKVEFESNISHPFLIKFRHLDVSIIVDNMISNAKKSKATVLKILLNEVDKNTIQLIFEDNGKGLDKSVENLDEIFEKGFSTTKSTGLGLFHIKNLIDDYNWQISADFESQKGARFIIEIKR